MPMPLTASWVLTAGSMISYPNYRYIFGIMALGTFARKYGDPPLA